MLSVAGRVLALLFALSWLVLPGFGLIDLSVTWSPDWPVMLEAGWGLFFSVFVGVSFLAVALVPRRSAAAVVQLCLASLALAVTAAVSLEWQALGLAAAVTVETAVVTRAQQVEPLLPLVTAGSAPLLLLTAAAAPPWLAYGWHMADLNRQELPSSDITISVDHYSVQAATALTMVALALLAALWPRGRRFLGSRVGVVALYLGVVSFAWPGTPGGFGHVWSAAAAAWGACLIVLAWMHAPGLPSSERVEDGTH